MNENSIIAKLGWLFTFLLLGSVYLAEAQQAAKFQEHRNETENANNRAMDVCS